MRRNRPGAPSNGAQSNGANSNGLAFISQSGALAEEFIDKANARSLPLISVVSVGNAVHLGVEDYLAWLGEQAMVAIGHDGHHLVGQLALEQFEHRADMPGTCVFDGGPGGVTDVHAAPESARLGIVNDASVALAVGDDVLSRGRVDLGSATERSTFR